MTEQEQKANELIEKFGEKSDKIMYYEEKIIDGVLHFKYSPDGKWRKFTDKQLTSKIEKLQVEIKKLTQ